MFAQMHICTAVCVVAWLLSRLTPRIKVGPELSSIAIAIGLSVSCGA